MATATLSVQEEAIQAGKATLHSAVTDRVLRMYEAIRGFGPPRVTLDRAVLFTESFKETESQPLVLRWAKALKHFVEKVPVTIFPDELIRRAAQHLVRKVGHRLSRARRQRHARRGGDVQEEQRQARRCHRHRGG